MSEEIARRSAGALGRLLSAPVHQAGDLRLSPVEMDADECWSSLGAVLRARIEQRAGPVVEWWAWEQDGRVHAVVLGRTAFVRCIPTVTGRGSAHRVETMRLRPDTVRTVLVGERSLRSGPAAENGTTARTNNGIGVALPEEFRAVIGHLPGRAQILLQEPFISVPRPLLADSFVYQTVDPRGTGSTTTTNVWCYITDYRTLTVVSGVGASAAPGSPVDWTLTCRRVAVGVR